MGAFFVTGLESLQKRPIMALQRTAKAGGKVPKLDQEAKPDRKERLAEQLRANLRKRKQQTRQRGAPNEAESANDKAASSPAPSVPLDHQDTLKD